MAYPITKPYIKLFFILLVVSSCNNQKNTILSFENHSNTHIDSVVFSVHNYTHKMTNIQPNTSIKNIVYLDSVNLHSHSLTIIAKLYIKDSVFRGAVNYDDLSGSPKKEYKLVLNKDLSTKIISSN